MKAFLTSPAPLGMPWNARHGRRGVALIAVLLCLMLLTVLLAAFLSAGAIEAKHAKVYTDGAKVNLLAQTAVNVVIAEIKEGTAGVDATGKTLAWASQPGMIRTYGSDGTAGNYYKLYSAPNMMGSGTVDPTEDLTAMDRWDDSPSFFTDLNSPVDVGGSERYPIISGNNLTACTTPYGTSALTYQTAVPGKPDIEGFWVESGPVGGVPPTTAASSRVPMPVQWLYVLQDGSVLAPEHGTGRKATISAATLQNPIVGRIAFWTDDESSKVNINTASEGIYMDTPRVATVPEFKLANFQPAQHEFQRYPGHPAMTSLSTVLGAWLPLPAGGSTDDAYKGVTSTSYATHLKPYYDLTPKIPTGIPAGSQGSTVKASAPLDVATARRQPLYSSVDELIFDVNRGANNAALSEAALEETRFFLTASSRSPDVNLYNTPRVCIWPISGIDDDAHRSPLDRLIGFCTTLNAKPYFFQRSDYSSPTKDISLARNAQLLTYLRNLGKIPVPGFGGTLAAKYNTANPTKKGTDLDQIYTQIFDYIRIANLSDQTVTAPFTVIGGVSQNEVVPSIDTTTDTKGYGRFLTVSQAALVFIATADGDWNKANPLFYKPGAPPAMPQEGQRRVQAALMLSLFDPSLGYPMMKPDPSKLVIKVTDLNSMTWTTVNGLQSMGFADTQLNVSTFNYVAPNTNRSYGGTWGPAPLFIDTKLNGKSTTNDGPPISAQAEMLTASGLLNFGGGTATVKIYYTDSAGAQNLIQTLTFNFPAGQFPLPKVVNSDVTTTEAPWSVPNPAGTTGATPNAFPWIVPRSKDNPIVKSMDFTTFRDRFDFRSNIVDAFLSQLTIISTYDTARAVQSLSGDIRLSAARSVVPAGLFEAHPYYQNSSQPMAHSLVHADGTIVYGATRGSLARITPPANTSGYFAHGMETSGTKWTPAQLSAYPIWSAPPGDVPFPRALSVPGKVVNVGLPTPAPGGNTLPNWTTNPSTSGKWGGYKLFSTEPEVRSTNGVVAGFNGNPASFTDFTAGATPGDWDNGMGNVKDGPYINKVDEGAIPTGTGSAVQSPYFNFAGNSVLATASMFSPNRQMPSAGMFGSLPTGVFANRPWQTLLFRPDPGGAPKHLGATSPPDHLFLDLFTIPVVEPYAISEPLSTAGRVNMNYQILPFSYINRDTGIRAVMKSERILSIPNSKSGGTTPYKSLYSVSQTGTSFNTAPPYITQDMRFDINLAETLRGFRARFASNEIFRSASEICSIDLIPQDATSPSNPPGYSADGQLMQKYWADHALTGDNSRERPYTNIYPRLTTKSNSFTIHLRVQSLQKRTASDPTIWEEDRDIITGEYRGSQLIERYIDPNDKRLPDYATNNAAEPLGKFYKIRTLSTKQFSP